MNPELPKIILEAQPDRFWDSDQDTFKTRPEIDTELRWYDGPICLVYTRNIVWNRKPSVWALVKC